MTNEVLEPNAVARKYVDMLPPVSSLFSSCIRTIKTAGRNPDVHEGALRELAVSSSSFLVGLSPTLKAVFYRAAETLYGPQLSRLPKLSIRSLLSLFSAYEITGILTISYLYRHIKRRAVEDEFTRLEEKLATHMEISSILGRTIRYIGPGNGLLLGGLEILSLALLSIPDLKRFQDYRRKLAKKNKLYNTDDELALFGCTHHHVAAALALSLGFGKVTAMGIAQEMPRNDPDMNDPLAEELLCWRVAVTLSQTFHETGSAPEVDESSEFYVPAEEGEKLAAECSKVLDNGSSYTWLKATKMDLPHEVLEALEIHLRDPKGTGSIEDLEEGEDAIS
jgi:hypothetical protein